MYSRDGRSLSLRFRTLVEAQPGPKWQCHFKEYWEDYKKWYLSEGEKQRPRYLTCNKKFREFFPELVLVWEKLTELAGGGDLEARFLSLYNPPPFLSGCSQTVWLGSPPALIRNYDYSPVKFEAVILKTNWLRPVIAVSDCLWGVVDGINDAGLAVSLTFGGKRSSAAGFGIPLILRYVLECCTTVKEAAEAVTAVPAHMAYNISLLDASGDFVTIYVSPDEPARLTREQNATNHQEFISWKAYADLTLTEDRKHLLDHALYSGLYSFPDLVRMYLNEPLYSRQYSAGFGTLYTSIYYPATASAEYLWPGFSFGLSCREESEPNILINYL